MMAMSEEAWADMRAQMRGLLASTALLAHNRQAEPENEEARAMAGEALAFATATAAVASTLALIELLDTVRDVGGRVPRPWN